MSLDNRMTELIAIGASIGANCQPCLEYHIAKAKEYGICEQEIQEAINVGKIIRRGSASKMDQFIKTLSTSTSSSPVSSDPVCECGCNDSC